uniref:Uncharacterized protein n=1 Tax=Arion vulgaris TaxID=1028688 RepID=A0A0B6ZLA3_9EUPU
MNEDDYYIPHYFVCKKDMHVWQIKIRQYNVISTNYKIDERNVFLIKELCILQFNND